MPLAYVDTYLPVKLASNDDRLIALVQYRDGVLMIKFFGSHADYDKVDAETV